MPFDLKSLTPDTSFGSGAVFFGADSQSAADPSVFPQATVFDYWKTLANTWSGVNTFSDSLTGNSNVLDVRNGTSAQTFQVFNTYSSSGTNYERLAAKFATYSSALQMRLAAESAGTGAANIGVNIAPKGTGAFILGPMPDGTSTGGNNRGNYAVDLQIVRSAATQIAGALSSFVVGGNNTVASGCDYSGAIGNSHSISSSSSAAFVAGESHALTSAPYSVAFGRGHTVSNSYASAFGSFVTVTGTEGFAAGARSNAFLKSQRSHASGQFASAGDAQISDLISFGSTTNATITELFLGNNGSSRMVIPATKTWAFETTISARTSAGTDNAMFVRRGILKRDGSNNTSLVGSVQTIGTDIGSNAGSPPAGWAVSITADDTNEALKVEVTGAAATNIRWVAHTRLVEVLYA